MSNIAVTGLHESLKKTEKHRDTIIKAAGYCVMAAVIGLFLIWYCRHPGYYGDEETAGAKELFLNGRTYFVLAASIALLTLWVTPNKLSDRMNRILSWVWAAAAPFAVYFSLLYLNATKFNIKFFELNPIAVAFTFWFLFLVLGALLLITGSIRVSVSLLAILIAVIGIANCFVISFRGTAISGADLFSLKTASTVAASYDYKIDWYIYMEAFLTFAICMVSFKLRRFRLFHWKRRLLVLGVWLILTGSFYHICCKTSFLEDHDIRSGGFTHQLRYKQYDMLFTTLCTCFYFSVDKPEGYSINKVQEIAADYLSESGGTDGEIKAAGNAGADEELKAAGNAGADEELKAAGNAGADEELKTAGNTGTDEELKTAGNGGALLINGKVMAAEAAEDTGGSPEGSGEADGMVSENTSGGTDNSVSENSDGGADGTVSEESKETSEDSKAASDDAAAAVETPNLIVIMNESLADYTDIGKGLEFSEDYMPFIHGLTENTIKGTAYASIFGANTPNSEYEFLTGNTMGFLPETSVGFNLFVRGDMPSLASELKSLGYTTLAMHPYRGTNYRRNIVYPQIGFDKYYDRKNFVAPTYIRKYISDQTLVERIIREFEKNLETETPFFSYNVTIQNHGGYTSSNNSNLDDSIQILTPEVDQVKTGQYANLVKSSDEAFEYLVTYFSEREEPTVIVMFGDHQPNLGDDTYAYLLGDEEELTAEELMEQYKVPFIAWANYDIQEETIEKTSLNYLYSILADRLNLPMTGYQKYLLDLSQEIPVLAAGGYWTADGEFYELDDEESPYFERINDYNILEYNYIFGKSNRYLEFFELQDE